MITLSVVIPVYQAKEYLAACIGSVLGQTFDDLEIILVDDGSTDGSAALCDRYAAKYGCIRAVHQRNGGASAARNRGLREARGQFVHFIDSDDLLSDMHVYETLARRAFSSAYDIIFFRRERFIDGVAGIDAVQPAYEIDGVYSGDVLNHVLSRKYEMTMTCPVNKIFRREFLAENDLYFTEGLDHEEDEWLPRVISCAKNVWFDKGVFYKVRNHPGSLSRIMSDAIIARRACSKIRIASAGIAYMEKQSLSRETMALIANYYWEYLIDACVEYGNVQEKDNKRMIYNKLKENRQFFDSYRYLTNRNRRALGIMFKTLGIRFTVKMVRLRYGK